MSDECTETEAKECEGDGGDSESSVVDQMKKAAANPWAALVIALLVGGGAGGASGLLGHQNDDAADECRRMVRDLGADQAKALESHSREDERRWAPMTDVAVLGAKIDALSEQVGEMREELRSARRPGRRQPPD